MRLNRAEKRQKAFDIFMKISDCITEDDIERLSDELDDLEVAGLILKKDYKFLCDELDDQLSYLVEKGLI